MVSNFLAKMFHYNILYEDIILEVKLLLTVLLIYCQCSKYQNFRPTPWRGTRKSSPRRRCARSSRCRRCHRPLPPTTNCPCRPCQVGPSLPFCPFLPSFPCPCQAFPSCLFPSCPVGGFTMLRTQLCKCLFKRLPESRLWPPA